MNDVIDGSGLPRWAVLLVLLALAGLPYVLVQLVARGRKSADGEDEKGEGS